MTFSSGCFAFQAATISLPQASSSGLFDSQILIGPLVARSLDEPPRRHRRRRRKRWRRGRWRAGLLLWRCVSSDLRFGVLLGGIGARGCGGGSDDEAAAAAGRCCPRTVPSTAAISALGRGRAPRVGVGAHGGQRRLEVGGDLGVVEAGDGQVAGQLEAAGERLPTSRRWPSGRWRRRSRSAAPAGRAAALVASAPPWAEKSDRMHGPSGRLALRSAPAQASRRETPCTNASGPATCAMCRWPSSTRCATAAAMPGRSSTATHGRLLPTQSGPIQTAGSPVSASSAGRGSSDPQVGEEDAVDPAVRGEPPVAGQLAVEVRHDLQEQRLAAAARAPTRCRR